MNLRKFLALTKEIAVENQLLFILAVGFVIRLVFLYTTRQMGLMIEDEQQYHTLALNLLNGHGFAWEPGRLTSARPPLYPALMAMVWAVGAMESVVAIRVVQVFLSLANVYVLYCLGNLLFDRRTGLLAAIGLCFYPSMLAFNFLLLTEVLFSFLLTLVLFGTVVLLKKGSVWVAAGTGAALGLATLTRSVLWPFPALLLPFLFFAVRGSWQQRFSIVLAVFLGYGSFVFPWAMRNTNLQGVLTVVDTMGGITLRMGNYEHTPLNRAWDPMTLHGDESILRPLELQQPDAASWTEGQKEKWALREALLYMLAHPGKTLQRSIIKFANFWGLERTIIAGWQRELYQPPGWFKVLGTLLIPSFYIAVMLFACFGIFRAPPADYRAHIILFIVIAFVAGMHSLTFGHERYHLPLIPILLLYGAAALVRGSLHDFQIRSAVTPLLLSGCLFVIWVREVFIIDADRIQFLLQELFK